MSQQFHTTNRLPRGVKARRKPSTAPTETTSQNRRTWECHVTPAGTHQPGTEVFELKAACKAALFFVPFLLFVTFVFTLNPFCLLFAALLTAVQLWNLTTTRITLSQRGLARGRTQILWKEVVECKKQGNVCWVASSRAKAKIGFSQEYQGYERMKRIVESHVPTKTCW